MTALLGIAQEHNVNDSSLPGKTNKSQKRAAGNAGDDPRLQSHSLRGREGDANQKTQQQHLLLSLCDAVQVFFDLMHCAIDAFKI